MKFDKFLQYFVVKEKRFFPLFDQSSANILKAAELLVEQMKSDDPEARKEYSHKIKEYEKAGDTITNTIVDELLDAYVTPFDRDDIHELAEAMDTLLDNIRDSAKKFAIYQPKEHSRKMVEMADYTRKAAEILVQLTAKFPDIRSEAKAIDALCDEIKGIEHKVDDVFESYMSNLLTYEKDTREIIKKKNVAQALEDTSDSAKTVSSVIRSIAVKMG